MKIHLLALLLCLFFAPRAHALKFTQAQIVTAGDMSAASILSPAQDMRYIPTGSIQALWTGAPVGTLILQTSADLTADPTLVANWSDFSGSSIAVNGPGDVMFNLANAGYKWIRLKYTKTSGSGTLNANISNKGDY